MKKESYDKKDWAITINNAGAQEPTDYYHLYCTHCKKVLLPKVSEEFKEGLGAVQSRCSFLGLKLDYVGCFLP